MSVQPLSPVGRERPKGSTRESKPPKNLPEWAFAPRTALETTQTFQRFHHWITDAVTGEETAKAFRQTRTAEYKVELYSQENQPSKAATSALPNEPVGLEPYSYDPLLKQNSIRLLALQPGLATATIECKLKSVSLENLPTYEALSYTWGNGLALHRIVCDGKSLCVRENLLYGLRQLRDPAQVRILWIDALCINQKLTSERNSQIQHMRGIYQKASRVVVWLGESSETSSIGFKLLRNIVSAAESESESDIGKPIKSEDLMRKGLPERSSPMWQALAALFWREWFTRVWIIQEVSATRFVLVVCGADACPWCDMLTAAMYIMDHSLDALTDVDPKRAIKLSGFHGREDSDRHLLSLLSEARSSFATDHRDKVYAILGLASDGDGLALHPDYSKDVLEVYTGIAKSFIERDGNLDILSAVEDHRYRLRPGLPCWVPDWEVHVPSSPFSAHSDFPWMCASGDFKAVCTFEHGNKFLVTSGQIIDSLDYVGDTFEEFIPASGNIFKGGRTDDSMARTRPLQWERMARKLTIYPTGETVENVFVQTLMGRVKLEPEISPDELPLYYKAWRRYWTVVHREHGKYIDFSHMELSIEDLARATYIMKGQQQAAYGRRFFTTKNGYMGLSPSLGRIGDKVVILLGGKTPFILRKTGKESHRFIGEAYVHGMMTGKGLSKGKDMQKFCVS